MVAEAVTAAPDRAGRGILLLTGGIFIFSIQDVIVRTLSGTYPVLEFVFFRSLFSIFPVLALVVLDGGLATLRVTRPVAHGVRGFLMLVGYTTYYVAVASAPLATVVSLFFVTPLLVTAMSALILKEPVGRRRWAAVGAGFGGILLILHPGAGIFHPGALIALASALVYSLCMIMTRRLGTTDSGVSMVATQTLVYVLVPGLAGLTMQHLGVSPHAPVAIRFLLDDWVVPRAPDLGLMAACGLIAAAGFYGLTQAYRMASPSVISPFEYTGIVWGIVWGYAFWSEVPDLSTFAGIAVIVGAGVYVLRREALRGQTVVAGRQLRQRG